MDRDEVVQHLLENMVKSYGFTYVADDCSALDIDDYTPYISLLERYNLAWIKKEPDKQMMITEEGRIACKMTFKVYKKEQIQEEAKEKHLRDQQIKLNKWFLRSKWLPHILSSLGLLISIISLIITLLKD